MSGYQRRYIMGLRERPFDIERPQNQILHFSNAPQHPNGQGLVEEGKVTLVYPDEKCIELVGKGRAKWLTKPEAKALIAQRQKLVADAQAAREDGDLELWAELITKAETPTDLREGSLFTLDVPDSVVDVLHAGGIDTVDRLIEDYRSGALQNVKGIGAGRLEQIGHALVKAGHLDESEIPKAKV